MSTKRVCNEDRLPQDGGSDAAFERDPVMNPTATAGLSRTMVILLAAVIAVLGLVVGTGSAAGGTDVAGSTDVGDGTAAVSKVLLNTVVIKNFAFGPATMVVAPGTKISVVNQDRAPHTITAVNKSFDTGTISGGQRGEFTAPNTPGTYPYVCTIHPSMTGTLIVK
jgi:plastocyanin